ncbi:MAG: glycosyltransferase family 9 protein [Pyrinomonadaceae bacterium]
MAENEFNFQNILVINFGQMGDVILSLPALKAIRERFDEAKITLMIGKPAAGIVRMANVSDEQIVVDRVEMRDGNKLRSGLDIVKLIRRIRINKFDLIIDLHSLSETNLLGFVSGAKHRLYSNRENRSLDRLASFPTKPPKEDKSKHYTDRYFDVLQPLGIGAFDGDFRIDIGAADKQTIEQRFDNYGLVGKRIVGFSVGAGHPSRCWELDKFAELSRRILEEENTAVIVFLGPEEKPIAKRCARYSPKVL